MMRDPSGMVENARAFWRMGWRRSWQLGFSGAAYTSEVGVLVAMAACDAHCVGATWMIFAFGQSLLLDDVYNILFMHLDPMCLNLNFIFLSY